MPIHPGFGQSADDPSIDSLHDYHLHYLDLFDKLGLDEVSLAGHSLGGALAANFAILQPRRVRRLVLVAPWGLRVPEHPTVDIFSIPDEQILEYLVADLDAVRGHADAAAARVPGRALPRGDLARARRSGSGPTTSSCRSGCTASLRPTLMLWGEADRSSRSGRPPIWADYIANSQVRTIAGAGHLVFDESAEAAVAVAEHMGAGVPA